MTRRSNIISGPTWHEAIQILILYFSFPSIFPASNSHSPPKITAAKDVSPTLGLQTTSRDCHPSSSFTIFSLPGRCVDSWQGQLFDVYRYADKEMKIWLPPVKKCLTHADAAKLRSATVMYQCSSLVYGSPYTPIWMVCHENNITGSVYVLGVARLPKALHDSDLQQHLITLNPCKLGVQKQETSWDVNRHSLLNCKFQKPKYKKDTDILSPYHSIELSEGVLAFHPRSVRNIDLRMRQNRTCRSRAKVFETTHPER